MIKAGNVAYRVPADLVEAVPVFPLAGALLLPGGRLPLNIFESRYLEMVDHALAGARLIAMIQPRLEGLDAERAASRRPALCDVGCVGRLISVTGVTSFHCRESAAFG